MKTILFILSLILVSSLYSQNITVTDKDSDNLWKDFTSYYKECSWDKEYEVILDEEHQVVVFITDLTTWACKISDLDTKIISKIKKRLLTNI